MTVEASGAISMCNVCADALTENQANCHECGAAFHLALRMDVGARDCGDAWIDDEVQAIVFGCNICLGRLEPSPPAPTVEKRRYTRREGTRASGVARARRAQRGAGRDGA